MKRSERRGNYTILAALSSTVVFGFAALAVDYSYLTIANMEVRSAADAGAHAAVIALRGGGSLQSARDAAASVIRANRIAGAQADVEPSEDIQFGRWDFVNSQWTRDETNPNAVRVSVKRTRDSVGGPIPLLIAPILGTEYAEAGIQAQSTAALRTREIMIVQDITGSFTDEILLGRAADLALLDHLNETSFRGDRLGLLVFTGGATILEPLQDVPSNYGSLYGTFDGIDWCSDSTNRKLQCKQGRNWRDNGLWDSKGYSNSAYKSKWNTRFWYNNIYDPGSCSDTRDRDAGSTTWLRTQMPRCTHPDPPDGYGGGTSQGAGLQAAIQHLIAEADNTSLRVIVLVSDGELWCNTNNCTSGREDFGIQMAQWAEDEHISIYSVSYNENGNANQRDYMESLITGYGRFYETPDETELPQILGDIARSIPVSLVE